jgi:hypothetical protein
MALAALTAAGAAAGDALAQPRTPSSFAGAWVLETAPHRVTACVIRGDATVTPAADDAYDVRIRVSERCPRGTDFTAEERCTATSTPPRVLVRCVVVRADPDTYNPDTFALEWRGADVMVGRLADDAAWNEPVTWRRAAPALVS